MGIKHSRPVPPFMRYCSAIIPTMFDDSLSYYEALCALNRFIQKNLVEVVNNNATVTQEYIELTNQLKEYMENYFDNLDVQEEINNKLDAMAEAGTLADIISEYLNSIAIFGYNTVADMKSAENLVNGSFAHTTGYYNKNDGGEALYKIRTITNEDVIDESFILSMNDENLVAELIYTDNVNTKQLGVIGLADATTKVQSLIDKSIADGFVLEFGNQEINITSIDFKTAKLTFDKTVFKAIGDSTDVAINISNPAKNACYSGFMVDGNFGVGVEISNSRNLELSSIVVKNCITGVRCLSGYGIRFHNSQIENNADKVDGVGLDISLDDSAFEDIIIQGFRTGLKTSSWCIGNMYERIHIWSIIADTVKNSVGFDVYDSINLRDCVIDTCKTGIKVNRNGRINIQACRWYWNTEYYDDTILEGEPTQLFYFADATVTANVAVRDCYCFKPAGTSVLRFSNLNETDWKSTCDVKNCNPNLSGVSKKPYGYITAFTTPESLTDNINKIVSTESAVTIDYVGKIANDATIGDLNIGTLEANCRGEYSMNAYCAYGAQWDNPDGVAYLYVNSGGAVAIKVSSAMLGKYIKVHYVIPR